jgi:3-oxoacyl-[acyl-carrier protein] reductase
MKTILITGSSRGIGKAIAELAHKKGYKVIVHGKSQSEDLDNVHAALNGSLMITFDVADKQATHEAISNLSKEVGTIDILVNNAGVVKDPKFRTLLSATRLSLELAV